MSPTAAPAYFPYPHRNMAELMGDHEDEREAAMRAWVSAMAQTCPRCNAGPKEQCTIPSGRLYGGMHSERRRA